MSEPESHRGGRATCEFPCLPDHLSGRDLGARAGKRSGSVSVPCRRREDREKECSKGVEGTPCSPRLKTSPCCERTSRPGLTWSSVERPVCSADLGRTFEVTLGHWDISVGGRALLGWNCHARTA